MWDRLARPEVAVGAGVAAAPAVAATARSAAAAAAVGSRCGGTEEAGARERDGGGNTDVHHHQPNRDDHHNHRRGSRESGGLGDSGDTGARCTAAVSGDPCGGQGGGADLLVASAPAVPTAASRARRGGEAAFEQGGDTTATPNKTASRASGTSSRKPNVPPLNLSRQPNTGSV